MKLLPKHKGLNPYRLASNLLETRFAEAWQTLNETASGPNKGADTVDYILHTGEQHFPKHCSERDRKVANSIIQWLGSPVGESFVRSVLQLHDMEAEKENAKGI